jgi:hypothetical protein
MNVPHAKSLLLYIIGHIAGGRARHRAESNFPEIAEDDLRLANLIACYKALDGDMQVLKNHGLIE